MSDVQAPTSETTAFARQSGDGASGGSSDNTSDGGTNDDEAPSSLISELSGISPISALFGLKMSLVSLVFGFFLLGAGFVASFFGFYFVDELRPLERTPNFEPAHVIEGTALVSGTAVPVDEMLSARHDDSAALFYHYELERYDDDEGWEEHSSIVRAVDFRVQKGEHSVLVPAEAHVDDIEFDAERTKNSEEVSDTRRYTLHRIDPDDEIFVFGEIVRTDDGDYRLEPTPSGGDSQNGADDTTLVSYQSEDDYRQGRVQWSIILIGFGVLALLVATSIFLKLARVRHSAIYMAAAAVVIVLAFGTPGIWVMVQDLQDSQAFAEQAKDHGSDEIARILEDNHISWDGDFDTLGSFDDGRYEALSATERERLSGVRMTVARSVQRSNAHLSRVPERFVAPLLGIDTTSFIEIPETEQHQVDEMENERPSTRLGLRWGFAIIAVSLVLGVRLFKKVGLSKIAARRAIESVPTSSPGQVVFGLTNMVGTVEKAEQLMKAPLTEADCVFFRYNVTESERTRDGDDSSTSTTTLASGSNRRPFYCTDQEHRILVDPGDADELSTRRKLHASRSIPTNSNERTLSILYSEDTIRPGDDVYIYGRATVDPNTHDRLIVNEGEADMPFIVTTRDETNILEEKSSWAFVFLSMGIGLVMSGLIALSAMVTTIGPGLYWTAALLSLGIVVMMLGTIYYNDLVFQRQRVARAWANIDVALQKRFDLVENLASMANQYLNHQQQLLDQVARARKAVGEHSPGGDEIELEQQVRHQVVGCIEDHPQLESEQLVRETMQSLRDIEDDIAFMREGYNDAVERYNNLIRHIPEMLIALPFGFRRAAFYSPK